MIGDSMVAQMIRVMEAQPPNERARNGAAAWFRPELKLGFAGSEASYQAFKRSQRAAVQKSAPPDA
jgi:hypothetical protein